MKTITITLFAIFLSSCSSNPFHSEWYWETADAKSVQQKIKEGSNVNERDNGHLGFDMMPLHYAVRNGDDINAVQVLIDAGADVNAQNSFGATSLGFAVGRRKSIEIVRTLINAGANVNHIANDGLGRKYSILDLTEEKHIGNGWTRSSNEIVNLLKKHGAKYYKNSLGKGGNDIGEIATALAGIAVQYQANKQGFNQPIIANTNFPTNSGNVSNNIASASGCSPLPPRCQSANASAERNLISCKSQDTGGIRGAALSQECALKAAIYAGKICQSEFRKMGKQQCEYQMKQQVNAWNNALISAVQTIRQVSGSGNSGGSSVFNGGNEQRARSPRRGGEVGKCPPGQYPDGNATATGCGPILR